MEILNNFYIQNNLIYFEFDYSNVKLNSKQFEIINNFKSLKYLILSNIYFSPIFKLKLINLEHLKICDCSNITFNNCIFLSLKYLQLENIKLIKDSSIDSLIKCPELNELILKDKCYNIDFKNLIKLTFFEGNFNDFLQLQYATLLETLIIYFNDNESDLKLMETLKNKEKYYFVKKLKLNLIRNYYNLNELINIFPNLFELIVEAYYHKKILDMNQLFTKIN